MRAGRFPELDFAAGVDPSLCERLVPNLAEMRECGQDPEFHAEGDAWTHTMMVCRALAEDTAFLERPPETRRALSWAALLHDVAKPATRVVEWDDALGRERVSHPHHAAKGARMAWAHMWRLGAPLQSRLAVYGNILWHQRVFWVMEKPDWRAELIRFSQFGTWRDLITLARADNLGRISPGAARTASNLDLTWLAAEEEGCLDGPFRFESDEARVRFARSKESSAYFVPPKASGSRVVVLAGIPGSGKDTYADKALGDWPQVSLDRTRDRMGVVHGKAEGQVWQAVLEEARVHLRAKRDFVWNATSVTRLARDKIVELALDYDARVEIHALDGAVETIARRNAARDEAVPQEALDRFVERFEPPLPTEAHSVVWVPSA